MLCPVKPRGHILCANGCCIAEYPQCQGHLVCNEEPPNADDFTTSITWTPFITSATFEALSSKDHIWTSFMEQRTRITLDVSAATMILRYSSSILWQEICLLGCRLHTLKYPLQTRQGSHKVSRKALSFSTIHKQQHKEKAFNESFTNKE